MHRVGYVPPAEAGTPNLGCLHLAGFFGGLILFAHDTPIQARLNGSALPEIGSQEPDSGAQHFSIAIVTPGPTEERSFL